MYTIIKTSVTGIKNLKSKLWDPVMDSDRNPLAAIPPMQRYDSIGHHVELCVLCHGWMVDAVPLLGCWTHCLINCGFVYHKLDF